MPQQNITIQTKSSSSSQNTWNDGMVKTTASQVSEEADRKFVTNIEKNKIQSVPINIDGMPLMGQNNLHHLYITGDPISNITKTITYVNIGNDNIPIIEDGTNIYLFMSNGHNKPSMILKFNNGTDYPVKYFGDTNSSLLEHIKTNTIIELQFYNNAWNIVGALDYTPFIDKKVTSNNPIVAGTSAKVTYDSKGLITGNDQLIESDIPSISIDKVIGLTQIINDLMDSTVIDDIVSQLNTKVTTNGNIDAGTATKVSYDSKGLVTGGTNLIEADIPIISIDKVQNLQSILDLKLTKNTAVVPDTATKITYDANGFVISGTQIDSTDIPILNIDKINNLQNILDNKLAVNPIITPGTAVKVTYDAKGLITDADTLISSDIPEIPISKVTGLDDALANIDSSNVIADIQSQMLNKINKNSSILPGLSTKVSYDSNGLVTAGSSLISSDIPEIPISKVTGLQAALDASGSESSITDIRNQLDNKIDKNADITAGIGIKVNYDIKGLITGKSDLLEIDIPSLNINKIINLQNALDAKLNKNNAIVAGTATKVTYDANGLITKKLALESIDIPNIDIAQINNLQETLDQKASNIEFDGLNTSVTNSITSMYDSLSQKITMNDPITPSIATKVSYDSNGLVIGSFPLTVDDMPALSISNLPDLQPVLDDKAPISHATGSTTYGVASAIKYGHAMAGNTISSPGDASVGTDNGKYARADHVHPLQINITGDANTVDGFHLDQDVSTIANPTFKALNVDSIVSNGDIEILNGNGDFITSNGHGLIGRASDASIINMVSMIDDSVYVGSKDNPVVINAIDAKLRNGQSIASVDQIPSSLPANGGNADTVAGFTVEANVPNDAVFTDTIYVHPDHTGDVTSNGDGVTTIGDDKITTSKILDKNITDNKLSDMADNTIKGTIAAGSPQNLTVVQVKQMLNIDNVQNIEQLPLSQKGTANGVAELDADGLVPLLQLPAFDITKDAIEAKLTGTISTHRHDLDISNNAAINSMISAASTFVSPVVNFTQNVTKQGKNLLVADDLPASLPASDVSEWAKAPTKPTYTASEVGAVTMVISDADPTELIAENTLYCVY